MQRIAASEEIRAGELFSATVDGTKLLISRVDGEVKAVIDKCTHLGMPMRRGKDKFDGRVIVCPFHGSRFDITTGENLDWVTNIMGMNAPKWACKMIEMGKKPAPLTQLEVSEKEGEVFVTLAQIL
jgi:nitrite reductase/ring-hydroxylating ferredoxin subunit